jgi:hypothetical protein
VAVDVIQKLKFELLPYPAYSVDLTPSDYHMFTLLRAVLCGCQFANNEVKDALHTWHHTQLKTFFTDGIRKLMDESNKCVEKLNDYVEKWQYICFCVPFVK